MSHVPRHLDTEWLGRVDCWGGLGMMHWCYWFNRLSWYNMLGGVDLLDWVHPWDASGSSKSVAVIKVVKVVEIAVVKIVEIVSGESTKGLVIESGVESTIVQAEAITSDTSDGTVSGSYGGSKVYVDMISVACKQIL